MKKRNIFICGPDMCGKTQIAKELSRRINVPYFKPSDERLTFLNNQENFINHLRFSDPRMVDFLSQTGHRAIFDRGFPCEWVYSKYFDRQTDMDALRYIDSSHSRMETLVVITYRSSYQGITDDLDSRISSGELEKIERLYRDFSGWTGCETFFLNVDSENLDEEVNSIISKMEEK